MRRYLQQNHRVKGFTIVELLVVIVVIGILAAIAIVAYNGIQADARDKAILSDIDAVESELARSAIKNSGLYASSLAWDSSTGANANINFIPSQDNTVVVTIIGGGSGYCIKAYNTKSNHKTLATASQKGSSPTACTPVWAAVATGGTYTCGVTTFGKAYCWGFNNSGQLGNNSITNSLTPVAVDTTGVLAGKTIKTITANASNACAIASDDKVYCWGDNSHGQLGNNSTTNSRVPVAVNTSGVLAGKTVLSLSSGLWGTCAIASDNNGYCWGKNDVGQLGNGTTTPNSPVPVAVTTSGALAGKTLISISGGNTHNCALASDGRAYCWGQGTYGQLGNGSTGNSSVPVAVTTSGVLSGLTLTALKANYSNNCAIASNNALYCWGGDSFGENGKGSTGTSTVPVAVVMNGALTGKTPKALVGSQAAPCTVTGDGGVYCWGFNPYGELGNSSTANSTTPVAVVSSGVLSGKTLLQTSYVAPSAYHTCVIATDGTLSCWGRNGNGQLGNGATVDSSVPVTAAAPPSS